MILLDFLLSKNTIGLKNISKHFKNKKGKLKENMFLGKVIILRVGDTF